MLIFDVPREKVWCEITPKVAANSLSPRASLARRQVRLLIRLSTTSSTLLLELEWRRFVSLGVWDGKVRRKRIRWHRKPDGLMQNFHLCGGIYRNAWTDWDICSQTISNVQLNPRKRDKFFLKKGLKSWGVLIKEPPMTGSGLCPVVVGTLILLSALHPSRRITIKFLVSNHKFKQLLIEGWFSSAVNHYKLSSQRR